MIIIIILLCVILCMILGISYYAFRIPFTKATPEYILEHEIPPNKEYERFLPDIKRCVTRIRSWPFEGIYTTAFDGKKLYARYYHAADNGPVQIFFHGYKSSAYRDHCGASKLMLDLGCNLIIVDQRSHCSSEGDHITFGIHERRDCVTWINYVLERFGPDTKILLGGLSMGAATVLMAADMNLPKNVIGIMADCPYSSPKAIIQKVGKDMGFPPKLMYPFVKLGALLFGHFNIEETDALRAVANTDIPILLYHGQADVFVPHYMSEEIAKACASPITFVSVPEADHGLCYMVDSKRYEFETIQFVQKVLKDSK